MREASTTTFSQTTLIGYTPMVSERRPLALSRPCLRCQTQPPLIGGPVHVELSADDRSCCQCAVSPIRGGAANWVSRRSGGGHLAASALAGLLARRLTRCSWVGVAVTAVFGLHFAHVETVAWFGSIAEVLGGVLALGAALAFLQFRESGRTRWAWTAVGLYSLALGANPTAAPILGFFLLVDLWRFTAASADAGVPIGSTFQC